MNKFPLDYRKLFESLPGLYLILQPDLTIVAVSEAYLRATMTVRENILGRGIFEIFPDNPDDRAATGTSNLRASLLRVIESRVADTMAVQKYDVRRPESEGGEFEVRHWSPVNSPILAEDGQVRYVIHRVEDVTEFVRLKQLEVEQGKINQELQSLTAQMESDIYNRAQELQLANARLREANEEQDRFFSVSLDMLCISGFDGYFKRVNPAFEMVLGHTKEEICTKSYLDFIHPDDIEITKQEVERQLSTKQSTLSFENRYRCKDGSYRMLSWKSVPIGALMYAAARDVTESKKAEEALKQATAAAEAANQELEQFSSAVAHDLRAPLRSMMGFSNILLEEHGSSLGKAGGESLARVIAAAKKMSQLIDGLLDLSRLTRQEMEKRPVNLTSLARGIANELKETQPDRKVEFAIAEEIIVHGDGQLLKSALTNLLGNAWKYTSKRATDVKIELGVTEHEGGTAYFVRDNGAGFEMKYASKLFGTFQRLHSTSEFEGIGIGLATVQRIIRRHGGKIWATGSVGQGATFYFTL